MPGTTSEVRAGGHAPGALLVYDELFLGHDPGSWHVESPRRLEAILGALRTPPPEARWIPARDATRTELERVHAARYLDDIERLRGVSRELDPDTVVSSGSVAAAVRAAGAVLAMTDALLDGEGEGGFALVRPPGHHAEREEAMGFCLFNNVALAAEHARARGVERVAIVDWDVHHGNGTQHHFEGRRDVLFVSTHRFPFYPGTGAAEEVGHGPGHGFTVNVPMPQSTTDGDLGAVFRDLVAPILSSFRPGLVLVSAGFDPHQADPMGGMLLTTEGFAGLCATVRDVAREARAPVGLVLEGGYDLHALADSVRACVEVLCGARAALRTDAAPEGAAALKAAAQHHARFWNL